MVAKFDADKQFGTAIKNFGAVVLEAISLYTDADMRGMDAATLDKYGGAVELLSFPQIRPLDPRPEIGKRDRINLIRAFSK